MILQWKDIHVLELFKSVWVIFTLEKRNAGFSKKIAGGYIVWCPIKEHDKRAAAITLV